MQIRESMDGTYFWRVQSDELDEYGILLGTYSTGFADDERHLVDDYAQGQVKYGRRVQIIRYVPMGSTGEDRYK